MQSENTQNTKKKDLAADIRARFSTISAPIDSSKYAKELNDWVEEAYSNGTLKLDHLEAVVKFFKVFNMSSKEAATTTLEEGLKKAASGDREKFNKAKPTTEKKTALILIKELIDATADLNPRAKTAANWARVTVLVEEVKVVFGSMSKFVVPVRRALIMTKFMWNVMDYNDLVNGLYVRYQLAFSVLKYIKEKAGGLTKVAAKSTMNNVVIESEHYMAKGLLKVLKDANVTINSPGIEEDSLDSLMEAKKFSLSLENLQIAIGGCVLPSVTHLLMSKDYRIAKSPSGTPGNKKGDPALIKTVRSGVAGLMLAVIRFFEPQFQTKDIDLDPKKDGELRTKYWECYKMLTTTIRQLNYTLYGKQGGANTRNNMVAEGVTEYSFGSLGSL